MGLNSPTYLGEQNQHHHNNSNNTKSQQTLASLRRISEERSKTDEFNDDDDSSGHGVSGRHNSSDLLSYDPKLNLRGSITSSNGGHTAETLGSTIKYKRSSRRASYPTRRVTNDNNDQGQQQDGQGGQTTSDEFNVRAAFEKEHKGEYIVFCLLMMGVWGCGYSNPYDIHCVIYWDFCVGLLYSNLMI